MKKPWQIWTLFAVCLLVVVPAMVGLSWQALNLDRVRELDRQQTELARREAELQERVSSAMWRMDGFLTSLIAKEATRPWYLYQSFYDVAPIGQPPTATRGISKETADGRYRQASPLMLQRSEFVVLHFQIGADNYITSPQIPQPGPELNQALTCGITDASLKQYEIRIQEVATVCDFDLVLAQCSPMMLPDASFDIPVQSIQSSGLAAQTAQQQGIQQLVTNANDDSQTDSTAQMGQSDLNGRFLNLQNDLEAPLIPPILAGGKGTAKQQVQQTRNMNRGNIEFSKRRQSADNYAMNEWMNNSFVEPQMVGAISASSTVREGVMQPLWIDGRLILARRVTKDLEQVIQCCWLDWDKIQQTLKDQVSDILPEFQFQAVGDGDVVRWGQALATLPVQLVINRDEMISQLNLVVAIAGDRPKRSGIRMSLVIAWCGLAFAAIAGAFLLHGVMRLSERRGAFVSAVSHELRTPLTTFRMYAEMLAEKMVPPERQQQYAQTLKVEAERLSHLVENVLQFARLERSNQKNRLENVTLTELLDRFRDRLEGRAERAAMTLVIEIPDEVMKHPLMTDPAAIEQILFNLVDNACKYARNAENRAIELTGNITEARLQLTVHDHGPGFNKHDRHRMFQPFRKSDQDAANSAQGVGLGLALCRRMARSMGGSLTLADTNDGAQMVLDIPV